MPISGLPKVIFSTVAEAVAVDGKTSATVAVDEAVAEGQKSYGVLICLEIWCDSKSSTFFDP